MPHSRVYAGDQLKKYIILAVLAILTISCNFPLLRTTSSPAPAYTAFTREEYKSVILGLSDKYDDLTNQILEVKYDRIKKFDSPMLQQKMMDLYDQQVILADQMAYQPPPSGFENVQANLKKMSEALKVIRKMEGDYIHDKEASWKLWDYYDAEMTYHQAAMEALGEE
jgi:hypothetical protein